MLGTKGEVFSGVTSSTINTGTTYGMNNGMIDYSQPHHNRSVTTVRSYNYKSLSGNILLTKDLERALMQANRVIYRIYYGDKFYTFFIDPSDLETLKDFLANRGQ